MNQLEEARAQIATLDKEMAALFEQRMRQVESVLSYKMAHGLPILDANQEEKVLARNVSYIQDPTLQEYYVLFQRGVMEVSKSYQSRLMQGMKIAYCGIPGAFAHSAALQLFPDARTLDFPDFEAAYKACEEGVADVAILPIENSYAGDVGRVMDLGFEGSLFINRMVQMDVTQNLLAVPGATLADIRRVVSHPQALAQCSGYIREHHWEEMEYANTAMAAQFVADTGDKSLAAIASLETARLYGLDVLESHINASKENTTRFAVFSKAQNAVSQARGDDHFILIFTVRNEAGALAKILNIIGAHGFNMSSLHSRPMTGQVWKHYFFAELEGNVHSVNGQDLLRQLSTVCDKLKMTGSYRSVSL